MSRVQQVFFKNHLGKQYAANLEVMDDETRKVRLRVYCNNTKAFELPADYSPEQIETAVDLYHAAFEEGVHEGKRVGINAAIKKLEGML